MNPVAVLIGVVGVVLLVIGFKGKQDDLITAITGKTYGSTKLK